MHIKAKAISAVHAFGAQFPNEFVSDLNLLMSKHKIELNMNQFLHSIDASRLVFTLLRDVFIRIPYTVVEFEPKNIAKSVDTIKKWIAENFSRFTTRIWNQAFYIEPIVYSRPVEEQFIKSCTYLVENFETMFNLLKVKRNEITVYSKHVDLVCFDKFMSILNEKRDLFSGVSIESATFENDLKIVQELLLFTNLCLSTNSSTEFDSIKHNYLVENWFLKKYLNVCLISLGLCKKNLIGDVNVFNPLRLLVQQVDSKNYK